MTKALSYSYYLARLGFVLLSVLLFAYSSIHAQTETGQINGRVIDPNGALVPNASVMIRSVDTGIETTATTGSEGTYAVANLKPGLYDVTVNTSGFAATTQRPTAILIGVITSLVLYCVTAAQSAQLVALEPTKDGRWRVAAVPSSCPVAA